MPTRTAQAHWTGALQNGSGTMRFGSGAFEGKYSFNSRMENGTGTNPEELIGAASAGCFSMAFAAALGAAGHQPQEISTDATVHFEKTDKGWTITKVELNTEAVVPGIEEAALKQIAGAAEKGCPVSKALTGTEVVLNAKLKSGAQVR
ncbi:MAG: OsmC family peroxiredoxin [Candidatus Dormibacteraeota bacterium]|nr:OsmC family peroxiredoxin [Candidatus Dormibacteraeota bacterium]